jgi:hypothetical protein
MTKFQITQKTLVVYQIIALIVFLISILYVPTIGCESENVTEVCMDTGWQLFTELHIDTSEKYTSITSLKVDVYIIQIILTFVSLFGIYRILKSLSK